MRAIQPDDYFAANEERLLASSAYLTRKAGRHVKPLTPEDAAKASRHNTNTFRRTRGKKCPLCGDPIDSRAHARREHARLVQEEEDVNEYKCDQCDRTFATEQGLRVHKGRSHSKMARKPKPDHPWRSPAVMPDTAPEQKVDAGEEPMPDEGSVTLADLTRDGITLRLTPDYRMELIEALADLADRELYIAENIDLEERDSSMVYDAIARIKAVARS